MIERMPEIGVFIGYGSAMALTCFSLIISDLICGSANAFYYSL